MVARFSGASLGLLAFAATTVAGLYVGNPPTVILSRSILALFAFCILGLLLGRAAQSVVAEFERNRKAEVDRRFRSDSAARDSGPPGESKTEPVAAR